MVGGGNYIEHQNLQVLHTYIHTYIYSPDIYKFNQIKCFSNFIFGQDYVKSRNAAYGNNSASIGSQKRVSDSMHCFSEEKHVFRVINVQELVQFLFSGCVGE